MVLVTLTRIKNVDLVKWSTTIHIESFFFINFGNPDTKSQVTHSHFQSSTESSFNKPPDNWCLALICCHVKYFDTKYATSHFHIYPSISTLHILIHLCHLWVNREFRLMCLKYWLPQIFIFKNTIYLEILHTQIINFYVNWFFYKFCQFFVIYLSHLHLFYQIIWYHKICQLTSNIQN